MTSDSVAAPGGQTLPILYQALFQDLEAYLHSNFNVTVRSAQLGGLLAFLVTAPPPGEKRGLVISQTISDAERLYLYIHVVGHVLLDAGRSHRTIWEPARKERSVMARQNDPEAQRHRQVDLLTHAILWGRPLSEWDSAWKKATVQDRRQEDREPPVWMIEPLTELLPGHRHRALRYALKLGLTRAAVLRGLRLVRSAYRGLGMRRALGDRGVARDLRELLCLTEVVTAAPELARAA